MIFVFELLLRAESESDCRANLIVLDSNYIILYNKHIYCSQWVLAE